MTPGKKAYVQLHGAIIIFGFTAILGALIQMPVILLVWWRVLLTLLSLVFLVSWFQIINTVPKRYIWQFIGIGFLVGLHWISFFGSIKLSNASVALVCMATSSLFTALLEPLFFKRKIELLEVLLGLLLIPGMYLVVNGIELNFLNGIWVGLISAFLMALFVVLRKRIIHVTNPINVTFLELGGAFILLSILLPFFYSSLDMASSFLPKGMDWIYLGILAYFCTTYAYVLFLKAQNHVSAFVSNLSINLEPIYGILLAFLLLDEHKELNLNFYIGVLIILSSVVIYPILKKYTPKNANGI